MIDGQRHPSLVHTDSFSNALDINRKYGFEGFFEAQKLRNARLDEPSLEFLLDSSAPFYYDPSAFVALDKRWGPPVFFLTKHLARNDLRKILDELEIKTDGETWTDVTAHHVEIPEDLKDDCDDELWEVFKRKTKKSYILVEWDQDNDGTDHDMWRLLWGCYSYRG